MTSLSLPLPGFGYAMSVREYAMNKASLDTDERDGVFSTSAKSFINTAIRCSSFSLPYLTYTSSSYFIYLSQYANLAMGVGKAAYSAYSCFQGYRKNNDEKKLLAKKMAKEAILHGAFAYVDSKMLDLGSKVIIPVITTYVGIGALTDLSRKSKNLHNKFFSSSDNVARDNDIFEGSDHGVDDSTLEGSRGYRYPLSPESGEGNFDREPFLQSNDLAIARVRFEASDREDIGSDEGDDLLIEDDASPITANSRRLTLRSMIGQFLSPVALGIARVLTPITPFRKAQTPGGKKMTAQVRLLLKEADEFMNNKKGRRSRRIHVGSK
ncbi:MAG: hypothetical protein K1000chlam1_00189 [Candidatus Anoxychlamydiales bacterium]|nr:hypothetical protein [Candidatus Anoxychlamydiales bacterium]